MKTESNTETTPKNGSRKARWILSGLLLAAVITTGFIVWSFNRSGYTVVIHANTDTERSMEDIEHSAWDALLQKYVNEEGMVDYAEWQASAEDTERLDDYLNHLTEATRKKSATREAKLAYWINAYNAVTIKGILREYPTTSIRNHTSPVGYNIWQHLQLQVGEQAYSLNAIEHEILRTMDEPRIHFAIVCASIGCPRLLNEAYIPERLDEQLATNAAHFFAQDQNFRIDRETNTVFLSSILKWFAEDFGATQTDQLKTIASYLADSDTREFLTTSSPKVEYLDYDWNLNAQ